MLSADIGPKSARIFFVDNRKGSHGDIEDFFLV